jgi:ATP-dependent RNA helicase DDX1
VATHLSAQVWFHQCKSRGSGCQDVRLVEKGGCGLWYDEPTYLAAIQKRLGGEPIPEVRTTLILFVLLLMLGLTLLLLMLMLLCARTQLDSNMQLPGAATEGGLVYGQKKDQSDSHDTLLHLQQLTPLVKQLAQLESAAQKQYWGLRCGFSPSSPSPSSSSSSSSS